MRAAVALLLLAASCAAPSTALRVATDTNRPALAFVDRGVLQGFEIDLVKAVGDKLGRAVEFVQTHDDGLIRGAEGFGIGAGLDRGDYDVVVTSAPVSNDLRGRYGVTDAYLNAGPVLVTRWDGPAWGAWSGVLAVLPEAADAVSPSPARDAARSYWRVDAALDDLAAGRVAGVAAPLTQAAALLADNERLRAVLRLSDPLTDDELRGLLVAQDRDDLRDELNEALASLRTDGTLDRLHRRWLE